ncbi:MAG TPA: hypothetical protein HA272_09785 [Methanoregula sp.]|nr:hypothetical protein [Methanoregula sp.]
MFDPATNAGIEIKLLWRKRPWIDFAGKVGIRFCNQNRIAIDPDRFFDRDHDRDCIFKTGIRLQNENR